MALSKDSTSMSETLLSPIEEEQLANLLDELSEQKGPAARSISKNLFIHIQI